MILLNYKIIKKILGEIFGANKKFLNSEDHSLLFYIQHLIHRNKITS